MSPLGLSVNFDVFWALRVHLGSFWSTGLLPTAMIQMNDSEPRIRYLLTVYTKGDGLQPLNRSPALYTLVAPL